MEQKGLKGGGIPPGERGHREDRHCLSSCFRAEVELRYKNPSFQGPGLQSWIQLRDLGQSMPLLGPQWPSL